MAGDSTILEQREQNEPAAQITESRFPRWTRLGGTFALLDQELRIRLIIHEAGIVDRARRGLRARRAMLWAV
jgi:hypothetical protein